jgi:hypothetical protein
MAFCAFRSSAADQPPKKRRLTTPTQYLDRASARGRRADGHVTEAADGMRVQDDGCVLHTTSLRNEGGLLEFGVYGL